MLLPMATFEGLMGLGSAPPAPPDASCAPGHLCERGNASSAPIKPTSSHQLRAVVAAVVETPTDRLLTCYRDWPSWQSRTYAKYRD